MTRRVQKRDVVQALRAARRLALLAYDAADAENTLRRHQWHERQRAVQAQARRVEKLTHELGIGEEDDGESAQG